MKINILISINIGKFFFQWDSIFSYPYPTTRDISRISFVDPVYHSSKPPRCMPQPNGLKIPSSRCKHMACFKFQSLLPLLFPIQDQPQSKLQYRHTNLDETNTLILKYLQVIVLHQDLPAAWLYFQILRHLNIINGIITSRILRNMWRNSKE